MRATLLLLLACLLVPAAALADRAPTKGEKQALKRAANASPKTAYADCVTVRNVRVSTAGPWASATVQVCGDPMDVIGGVFRKRGGSWRLVAVGNGSVACDKAPRAVARDLNLGC